MAYPDTTLGSDVLDPEMGGQPSNAFGMPAWQHINNIVRFLARAFLEYDRVGYRTIAPLTTQGAAIGQVAIVDAGVGNLDGTPNIRPYPGGGLVTPVCLGIYFSGASAGARTRIITAGIVPASITGLAVQTARRPAGINPASGTVRVALTGDVVIGDIDIKGNLLFTGCGTPL